MSYLLPIQKQILTDIIDNNYEKSNRYDGDLIILSQGLTTFSWTDIYIESVPLQTYYYWYWYNSGSGDINGVHRTSKDYQVTGVQVVDADMSVSDNEVIHNLAGQRLPKLQRGINIIGGRKVVVR